MVTGTHRSAVRFGGSVLWVWFSARACGAVADLPDFVLERRDPLRYIVQAGSGEERRDLCAWYLAQSIAQQAPSFF